jgi:hypothetical protein
MAQYYDVGKMKQYIAANASKYGLDPATALKVWTNEGLADGVWQSNLKGGKYGNREPSYGPFQFLVGGGNTGYKEGMGNDFMRDTGLDPRDPKNVYAMADYAMAKAGQGGWSPWYAARDNNVGPWDGITKGVSKGYTPSDDNPSILPQNIGAFQLPHMPNFDPVPGTFNVQTAAGPAPASDPNASGGGGILSKIFGGVGQAPEPYWMKGKGWDEEAKKAYLAQGLQDKGWPSLRSFLG